MSEIDEKLKKLSYSTFRASFKLTKTEKQYYCEKGRDVIEKHARDFVKTRLAPADPQNDGRQTPMHGHPVFKAQHACACCCRGCLSKWHNIPKGTELTDGQQDYIVNLLMAWIDRQVH